MSVDRLWVGVFVALVVGGFLAGMGAMFVYTEYVDTPDEPLDEETVEAKIVEAVNQARLEANVTELHGSGNLTAVARAHSEDMSEREFVGHENPDGDGPFERVARSDANCTSVGENVAQTWWDEPIESDDGGERLQSNEEVAEWLVEQWLNSPGHRENMLDARWTKTGVGIAEDGGQVFATQKFCS